MNKTIQVLVSTMNDTNNSILDKMNLKEDVIVINQTDYFKHEKLQNNINVYHMNERGVGLSRNNALLRSSSDIIVFADDDLFFYDNYKDIILEAYNKYPKADGIIFNFDSEKKYRKTTKKKNVKWYNYMKYGTARFTFKRSKIISNRISFSLEFGGGTNIGSGEDSLFLTDLLKKKLKIIALPISYAKMEEWRDSTWFEGFDEKYYIDKGKLFYEISRRFKFFLILRFALKSKENFTFRKRFKLMYKGVKERKAK